MSIWRIFPDRGEVSVLRKIATDFGKPQQALRGLPPVSLCAVEPLHGGDDGLQPDLVGIPHRAAAPAWEAVAVNGRHVDVGRADGDALFQLLRPLVDHCIDATLDDLLARYLAGREAARLAVSGNEALDFRVRRSGTCIGTIAVPAGAALLAELASGNDIVLDCREAGVLGQGSALALATQLSYVEADQIGHREGAHRHAEVVEHLVDVVGTGTLLHEELGLAPIGVEGTVGEE